MIGRWEQRTHEPYGHTLNHRQIFSPDGRFVYYDTRNRDTDIQVTSRIERLDLRTSETLVVYETVHPNAWGPGVGAVVCHPNQRRLLFIHGLHNCSQLRPYAMTRRFGALAWDTGGPATVAPAEARIVDGPCLIGALRGGTHAHSWSRDGKTISFTYNDAVVERRARAATITENANSGKASAGPVHSTITDLRTVGVMIVGRPGLCPIEDDENFCGEFQSLIVAPVVQHPSPGSDEIDMACEECWVENRPQRTMAFLGRVRTSEGDPIQEVFLAEWTDPKLDSENNVVEKCLVENGDSANRHSENRHSANRRSENRVAAAASGPRFAPLDKEGRLEAWQGVRIRRLTRTERGISGPRNWLLGSPDGVRIYFPMPDREGIVQIHYVEIDTGTVVQLSHLEHSLENQLAIRGDGQWISGLSNSLPTLVHTTTGETRIVANLPHEISKITGAIHFLPDGSGLLMHAYTATSKTKSSVNQWLQLWTCSVHC